MNEGPAFRKTRIAPTPSGFLHLGNVLSFAITAFLAKRTGAAILLRVDDMDRERVNKDYVQDIFDTLNFMGINCNEGPKNLHEYENQYSQLHRINLYNEALSHLRQSDAVFACNCSRSDILRINPDGKYPGTCRQKGIPLDTTGVSWRMNTEEAKDIMIKSINSMYTCNAMPDSVKDFVVRKKDGFPAYQLTSVIDDLYFGIDLIVRGQDLWASTIAQHYLADKADMPGFSEIAFYHHPLLTGPDGLKLSKSAGSTSLQHLRKQHIKPADIYELIGNMLNIGRPISTWDALVANNFGI